VVAGVVVVGVDVPDGAVLIPPSIAAVIICANRCSGLSGNGSVIMTEGRFGAHDAAGVPNTGGVAGGEEERAGMRKLSSLIRRLMAESALARLVRRVIDSYARL